MSEASKTDQNLKTAFTGEAKACLRLLAYAEKAEQEGYAQMAHLFRAISAGERVHALKNMRLLREVESTEQNLKKSFDREITVSENYYPGFIQTADEEGLAEGRHGRLVALLVGRDGLQPGARCRGLPRQAVQERHRAHARGAPDPLPCVYGLRLRGRRRAAGKLPGLRGPPREVRAGRLVRSSPTPL